MADNLIEFEIQFKNAQASLRNIRKELEKELSGLKVDFDPKALSTLTRGSPSRVAAGAQGIKSGITDRIESKLADANKKLTENTKKRAELSARIANAEKEIAGGNKGLARTLAGLKGALTKQEKEAWSLSNQQRDLGNALDNIAEVMEAAGRIFSRGAKGIEFRGLQRELKSAELAMKKLSDDAAKYTLKKTGIGPLVNPTVNPITGDTTGDKEQVKSTLSQLQSDRGLEGNISRILKKKAKVEQDVLNHAINSLNADIALSKVLNGIKKRKAKQEEKELKDSNKGIDNRLVQITKLKEGLAKEENKQARERLSEFASLATIAKKTAAVENSRLKAFENNLNEDRKVNAANIAARLKKIREIEKETRDGAKEFERLLNLDRESGRKALSLREQDGRLRSQITQKQLKEELADRKKLSEIEAKRTLSNFAKQQGALPGRQSSDIDRGNIQNLIRNTTDISSQAKIEQLTDGFFKGLDREIKKRINSEEALTKDKEKANQESIAERRRLNAILAKKMAKAAGAQEGATGKNLNEADIGGFLAQVRKRFGTVADDKLQSLIDTYESAFKTAANKQINIQKGTTKKAESHQKRLDKLDRDIEAIRERGLAAEQKKLNSAGFITQPSKVSTQSTNEKSSIGNLIKSPVNAALASLPNLLTAALNPVKGAAARLTASLDAGAKRVAAVTPDFIIRNQNAYGQQLAETRTALTPLRKSLADLHREQAQLAGGYSTQLQELNRRKKALLAEISTLNSHQVFTTPEAGNRKRAAGRELSTVNSDIGAIEKTLSSEFSKKIAAGVITGKINEVQGKIAGLLTKEANIQEQLNNLKTQQAKVAAEKLAKETAAKNQGVRGLIRRFSERISSGGGRGPLGPSGPSIPGGPPPPPPNRPPSGGGDFFNRLKQNNSLLQAFHSNLKEGDKSAFKFGQTVRRAAENLAAWAAPSLIVFKTISSLQNAVSELIKLDTQVKRLTFFQAGGDTEQQFGPETSKIVKQTKLLEQFNSRMSDGKQSTALFAQGFKNLTDESNRTGLAINQVVEAANTVAQIGEVAFLADGTASEFLRATEGLVLLEGGALGASRAAEILVSIANQTGTSLDDVGVIAAKLSSAADSASLSFEGFSSVIARFASVAQDIQGFSLDQTIELADVAAKRFGTNASRTGTALKNLTTLIVTNKDKIEELTGVKIAFGENGKIKGADALFDVFDSIRELEGSAKGAEIAEALGGRQNLSDAINISNAVDELRERFSDLNDTQKSGARTNAQVTAFMTKLGVVSEGAEASVNRLDSAFKEFTQSTGAVKLVELFNESLTSFLKFSTSTIGEISAISGALNALTGVATVLFATFAKKSLLAGVGVFANKATEQLRREVADGLKKPFNIEGSVQKLREGGVIDEGRANTFLAERDKLLSQGLITQEKGKVQQAIVNKLRSSEVVQVAKLNAEQTKLNLLQKQFVDIKTKEFALRQQVLNQTSKTGNFKTTLQENAGLLIGVAAQVADTAFGDIIANAISNGVKDNKEKIRKDISSIFTGVTIGASLGSLGGAQAAAIGGLLGGIVGFATQYLEITGFINKAEEERERILKRNLDLVKQQKNALEFTKTERDRQNARDRLRTNLGPVEQTLKETKQEIEDLIRHQSSIEIEINNSENTFRNQQLLKESYEAQDKILALIVKEKELELFLSTKELDVAKQKLVLEQELNKIQSSRQRFDSSISLAKLINGFNKNAEQKLKIDLFLDKGQITAEIDNLQREIDLANREIFAAGDDPKKKGQRESAEKKILDLVTQQVQLRFKVIDADVNAQKGILDLTEKRLDVVLERFKTITSDLDNSFQAILGVQEKINALSSSNLDINTRRIQARRSENNTVRDVGDNTLQGRISANQARGANSRGLIEDFTRELSKLDAFSISTSQRNNINNRLPRFNNREDEILGLKNLLAEVTNQTPDAEGNFSKPQQVLQALLVKEEASVKSKIEADRRIIEIDRENANRRIDINEQIISAEREHIESIREEIDIIRERAAKEAELGDRAITDPESIIRDFIGANFAKQFVNSLNLNTSGRRNRENSRNLNERFDEDRSGGLDVNERLKAFIVRANEQLQRQGPRANAGILEGLKAQQRLRPDSQIGGVDINKAIEIFQRLNSGAGLQQLLESVGKETDARGRSIDAAIEIREAQNRLLESLNELKLANEEEITLQGQLRDVETERLDILIRQNRLAEQGLVGSAFTNFTTATDDLSATVAIFDTFMKDTIATIENLHTKFGDLGEEVGGVIDILRKDRKEESIPDPLRTNTPTASDVFAESIRKQVAEDLKKFGLLGETIATSIGESMSSAIGQLEEKLANTVIKVETDVPALEVKLNANVQNVINGDAFLEKLTEGLRGSGLEDRVEEIRAIVLQLVAVERVRGTRLLPGF